jgi:1-acyl-sn-glycerol-3-phosphate acyltransferase
MHAFFYAFGRSTCRFVRNRCIREAILGSEWAERDGPVLLAVTHLGHLEPMFISARLKRPVRWMARTEFYRSRLGAWCLRAGGAFPVDRSGYALPTIRRAVRLLNEGNIVGVFPEGGVVSRANSVVSGGPIRDGVCLISIRTGIPITPVVVLGTESLNRIEPWLPFHRGRIWTAFGRPVPPPVVRAHNRRLARAELSSRLRADFVGLYRKLVSAYGPQIGDAPGGTHE